MSALNVHSSGGSAVACRICASSVCSLSTSARTRESLASARERISSVSTVSSTTREKSHKSAMPMCLRASRKARPTSIDGSQSSHCRSPPSSAPRRCALCTRAVSCAQCAVVNPSAAAEARSPAFCASCASMRARAEASRRASRLYSSTRPESAPAALALNTSTATSRGSEPSARRGCAASTDGTSASFGSEKSLRSSKEKAASAEPRSAETCSSSVKLDEASTLSAAPPAMLGSSRKLFSTRSKKPFAAMSLIDSRHERCSK
eukprot:2429024-Pleurochrysis_carterae.AAC.1